MTTIDPQVDPTNPDHLYRWFDASRLTRGQLLKAVKLRQLPDHVAQTNVDLIKSLSEWLEANNIQRPAPAIEAEDDDELDLDDDQAARTARTVAELREAAKTPMSELLAVTPAAGVNSASTPAAGNPAEETISVTRADWDRMQATLDRLLNAQAGAVAKPLDVPVAVTTRPTVGGAPVRTGVFPGGYRAEHYVGPRDPDDAMHFALIEATHAEAAEAGYKTKGAPWAGLRIGYSADARGRTAIYEVSIVKDQE